MARKKMLVVAGLGMPEPKKGALKKQHRYGPDDWEPGMIPTRGTLRSVYGVKGEEQSAYREKMQIVKPRPEGYARLKAGKFDYE